MITVVPGGTRRKMILLLMIMTPGIPEYLTGSSRISYLIFSPLTFLIGLALNLGLYSTGAILIREFAVRFRKGWASVLLLGCAYGIMEEGISVHTFFQPFGQPVGLLAVYGRYAGVNWIWAVGLTAFHAVFSITLPLLLLAIAYPKHSREPLLAGKGIAVTGFIYMFTVVVLNVILAAARPDATPAFADYMLFALVSLMFVVAARIIPGDMLQPQRKDKAGMRRFFLYGFLVFPLYTLYAFLPVRPDGSGRIPPALDAALFLISYLVILMAISRQLPTEENDRHVLYLATGLLVPLFIWAELMELTGGVPMISAVTVIAIVLLLRLRGMIHIRLEKSSCENTPATG